MSTIDAMYREYRREFSDVPDVTAAELQALMSQGDTLIVDVRDPKERAVSTIPGALSADEFESRQDEHRNATVVAYCTIGYRSGLFAAKLRQQGIAAVNLNGGILAWCHAGNEVFSPDGTPTTRVHVYGRRWNLLPPEYEAIW